MEQILNINLEMRVITTFLCRNQRLKKLQGEMVNLDLKHLNHQL